MQLAQRLVAEGEQLGRVSGEGLACGRQGDAPAATGQQLHSEVALERGDQADTAGSVTTSAAAAARTDPVRATARKVFSWPNVIGC